MSTRQPSEVAFANRGHRLDALAAVAMLVASAVVILIAVLSYIRLSHRAVTRPEPALPTAPISLASVPFLGAESAKVVLLEFADPKCPFCARFAKEILPKLKATYIDPGLIRFGLRQFPLDALHPLARIGAEATVCAGRQGKFWEMHDALFTDQTWADAAFPTRRAEELNLNLAEFAICTQTQGREQVKADEAIGKTVGVEGTPTFFFGVSEGNDLKPIDRLTGAKPLSEFVQLIDRALAASRQYVR